MSAYFIQPFWIILSVAYILTYSDRNQALYPTKIVEMQMEKNTYWAIRDSQGIHRHYYDYISGKSAPQHESYQS